MREGAVAADKIAAAPAVCDVMRTAAEAEWRVGDAAARYVVQAAAGRRGGGWGRRGGVEDGQAWRGGRDGAGAWAAAAGAQGGGCPPSANVLRPAPRQGAPRLELGHAAATPAPRQSSQTLDLKVYRARLGTPRVLQPTAGGGGEKSGTEGALNRLDVVKKNPHDDTLDA
eukprot:19370-Chlamydomonas_euryale.AAC.5